MGGFDYHGFIGKTILGRVISNGNRPYTTIQACATRRASGRLLLAQLAATLLPRRWRVGPPREVRDAQHWTSVPVLGGPHDRRFVPRHAAPAHRLQQNGRVHLLLRVPQRRRRLGDASEESALRVLPHALASPQVLVVRWALLRRELLPPISRSKAGVAGQRGPRGGLAEARRGLGRPEA